MSQKKDLNISPYYDDFDSAKNFYKVLFKPGFPVQARELTNLQSILQNQIEDFGTHMFKEGSIVIPGAPTFDNQFNSVRLNPTQFGIDVSLYTDQLIGKIVEGQVSGVTATVDYVELPNSGTVDDLTIYVKYISAGTTDEDRTTFIDGESLISKDNIVYGNTTIDAGTAIATLISSDATSIGSSASVADGVYFIRGTFVNVNKQTIILDYYTNTPSYRVGFQINEEIIGAKEDPSLYDNAKGFTNYAAPGADRLKIGLVLTKKLLDDKNDTDFVEILRVKNGEIRRITTKTQYNKIRDYLAERTFEESGNYALDKFDIDVENSLNDRLGNNGIFANTQKTEEGNTPSDDLMCVTVSGGEAYVRGYDVTTDSVTVLDANKPRDVEKVNSALIPFSMGNILVINKVSGQPQFRRVVDLYGNLATNAAGSKIGEARIYSCTPKDTFAQDVSSQWNLRLYDVQTYTKLTINKQVSNTEVVAGSYIKGLNSGASGYATAQGGNSDTIRVRQTSGTFVVGEAISINGRTDGPNGTPLSPLITEVVSYNSGDIKTLKQDSTGVGGYTQDFVANSALILKNLGNNIKQMELSGGNTLKSYARGIKGIKVGDIIAYDDAQDATRPTYVRVTAIDSTATELSIATIGQSTANVYKGNAVGSAGNKRVYKAEAQIDDSDSALYEILPERNISSLDFTSSTLPIIGQITGEAIVGGAVTFATSQINDGAGSGISTAFFQPYNVNRYAVHYGSNSGIGSVTNGTFDLDNSQENQATIRNLTTTDSDTVVTVSALKQGLQSKIKTYVRSQLVNVTLSSNPGSGSVVGDTLNDKLTYNNTAYGLRIQDEDISLNVPDVANVIAVYESVNGLQPSFDTIQFAATANVGGNAIIGENIIGSSSNAIARVVTNQGTSPSTGNANKLGIVYLTDTQFTDFEQVTFDESNIVTNIEGINNADTEGKYIDISNSFTLDKGQKDQYYDYSKLVRKSSASIPSKRLLIVYDRYDVPSNDTGDAFTVLSYTKDRYNNDIPLIGPDEIRATDTLDFRPRVSAWTSSSSSPFDFAGRTSTFNTAPKWLLGPNESSMLGYDFYLGRIDKLYLDEYGTLQLQEGESSIEPTPPEAINNAMELATIILPPYLYDPDDSQIILTDNRRYTMRDIGVLEDRIDELETVTTLSLLEVSTEALSVVDAQGNDRFKSGFFVDNFNSDKFIDEPYSSVEVDTESKEIRPIIGRNSIQSQLMPSKSTIESILDFNDNFDLLDPDTQKTGNMVTLKYEETDYLEQALATRVENVNPFHVISFTGEIKLTPRSDSWVRTIQLEPKTITRTRFRTIERTVWGNRNEVITQVQTQRQSSTKNVIVSSGSEKWMRSRNTQFQAQGLRPLNRHYQFFDGRADVLFIPKLIEITPDKNGTNYGSSGTFSVGETVKGYFKGKEIINFRVAKSNHKEGNFNAPSKTYNFNPYKPSQNLQSNYTSSSNVLNVDTRSLASENQGLYSGYIEVNARLIGQESGAVAYVKKIRLVTDEYGSVSGCFFLKDPNTDPAPTVRIKTGRKTYKLSSSKDNAKQLKGSKLGSSAQSKYRSTGRFIVKQQQTTVNVLETTTITRVRERENDDPVAQSFTVAGNIQAPGADGKGDDDYGVFITSVDIFFARKDPSNQPVMVELRTVELGTPTLTVLGDTVTLTPDQVITSTDASKATNVKFPEPIYLPPGREYAVVLLAPTSDQYEVWIARMGEKTVNSQSLPNASSVIYTQQWAVGSLFKSQNGSIWSPSQLEDMKFKLYKAKFTSDKGSVFLTTPTLDVSNGYVTKLKNNPIVTLSKTGKIAINPSSGISTLSAGRVLYGSSNDGVTATISGSGFAVQKTTDSTGVGLTFTRGGSGYKDASAFAQTYNITGKGTGLTVKWQVDSSGAIYSHVGCGDSGRGYNVGDVVGIVTDSNGAGGQGQGAELTVTTVNSSVNNMLFLENIQGSSASGSFNSGGAIRYGSATEGIKTLLNRTYSGNLLLDGVPYDGKHFLVQQFDHGMHSNNNMLELNNLSSNTESSLLVNNIDVDEVTSISVASTSQFVNFEGIPVGVGSTGYVKVENEIIGYMSMTPDGSGGGTLDDLTRGIDGTKVIPHFTPNNISKYELNGVSLRRINTTHQISNYGIELDSYYVGIDTTTNGKNRANDGSGIAELSFNSDGFAGGDSGEASRNIQFESLVPNYDVVTPANITKVTGSIRTVSGTSIGGNEISFQDQGYQPVQLNTLNKLSTPRIVCSKINETTYLGEMERNKSFTTALRFTTKNENVSPILYTESAFTEFRTNMMNNPVGDYSKSPDVSSWIFDPHNAIYVSKTVKLNKPADGLRVILSAYRDASADFRVLYSLIRTDSNGVGQDFVLFPGYDNLKDTLGDGFGNTVIDPSKNSGLPDAEVKGSLDNQFLEYQFTADNVGEFSGYAIKIVMSGTNQAYPVRIKDLRTIALK